MPSPLPSVGTVARSAWLTMKAFVAAILSIVAVLVLTPQLLRLAGYYVNQPGGSVAKIAVERKDVGLCQSLLSYLDPLGPATGEVRSDCVFRYATLANDPAACERLLPGEYGMNCVEAAKDPEPCLFDFRGGGEVRGNGLIASFEDCAGGPENVRANACCAIARAAYLGPAADCDSLGLDRPLLDQCHHESAFARTDLAECGRIESRNIEAACQVQLRHPPR